MGAPEGIAPGGIGPSNGFIPAAFAAPGGAADAAPPAAGFIPAGSWGSDLSDIVLWHL